RRLLPARGRRSRRGDRGGLARAGRGHGRRRRGAPDRSVGEQGFREQWGRVLAALIGFLGDFDLAQEAAQEAFAVAAARWPRDGGLSSPPPWAAHTRATACAPAPARGASPPRGTARSTVSAASERWWRRRACSSCPRRSRTRWM